MPRATRHGERGLDVRDPFELRRTGEAGHEHGDKGICGATEPSVHPLQGQRQEPDRSERSRGRRRARRQGPFAAGARRGRARPSRPPRIRVRARARRFPAGRPARRERTRARCVDEAPSIRPRARRGAAASAAGRTAATPRPRRRRPRQSGSADPRRQPAIEPKLCRPQRPLDGLSTRPAQGARERGGRRTLRRVHGQRPGDGG